MSKVETHVDHAVMKLHDPTKNVGHCPSPVDAVWLQVFCAALGGLMGNTVKSAHPDHIVDEALRAADESVRRITWRHQKGHEPEPVVVEATPASNT